MSQQIRNNSEAAIDTCTEKPSSSQFPRSIISVSQEELNGIQLKVKKGDIKTEEETELPADLQGHVFIIAPVGCVDSKSIPDTSVVLPCSDGWTPVFNGDGMVYRLDFEGGKAKLTTKIVKTPCYYADRATSQKEEYKDFKFINAGMGRFSYGKLGVRNQLNTAFLPVKFSSDNNYRLLVTWDMGRPYEIDPQTLEVVAPVGWNKEWKEVTKLTSTPPFPQIMTSAHPSFDPHEDGEMFTVNVGKSLSTILWLERSLIPQMQKIADYFKSAPKESPFHKFAAPLNFGVKILNCVEKICKLVSKNDFVDLIRWDGKETGKKTGNFQKWKVLLPNGCKLKIEQTLHQIGLTKDYIILADTSFKFDSDEILPQPSKQLAEDSEVFALDLFDYQQLPKTNIYIVRRGDLNPKKTYVKVRPVQIPYSMAHFLVDYENPKDRITLHAAHICATDPSEYIRIIDRVISNDSQANCNLQQMAGAIGGPMDVSRLGCYVINAKTGEIEFKKITEDVDYTWATAFYVYRDNMPTRQFEDIYWNSWGAWPNIISNRIFNLYKDYEDRIVPIDEVLNIANKGIPSSLCHLHISRKETREVVDIELKHNYKFPPGYLASSAQFIPRAGKTGSTEGYIFCVVIHSDNLISKKSLTSDKIEEWSDNSEVWIFDAQKLEAGPLYRLSHSQLNFGFTLHTTWLPKIAPIPKRQDYNIRTDYNWLIAQQNEDIQPKIREIFEKAVYPHFEGDSNI